LVKDARPTEARDMSRLIVEVCAVERTERHPNADALEIVHVKGWQVCARLGQFAVGARCVYIPPESVLPPTLSARLGVTQYLVPLPADARGVRAPGGRVRVARLRGVASYGLIMSADEHPTVPVGTDVAEFYGITKFEPPPLANDGEALPAVPAFHPYSSSENFRNFPHLLHVGEEVIFTEKIHGMNSRLGLIQTAEGPTFMAGSHGQRRREFDAEGRKSRFWDDLTDPLRALLTELAGTNRNVIAFGEIFGSGVQDMVYGLSHGRRSWCGFDLAVDGRYLDYDERTAWFTRFGIPTVPILYRGPFSVERVEDLCTGPTTVCTPASAGKFSFREGIVMVPVCERYCPELGGSGRLILKAINPDYSMRKGGTEYR
jgi:RNA ligase (TIGR02306 family)